MTRSKLSDKFLRKTWEDFERSFKKKYKEEEGKPFKGSVIQYVTVGVIQRKGLPDVEDVTLLMRQGLFNKDDETIDNRLTAYFEDEENKAKGYAGAFCDLCKDLTLDIPVHPQVTDQIMNLDDFINKRLEATKHFNELLGQLSSLKDKLNEAVDKNETTLENKEDLGVDDKDTQENK